MASLPIPLILFAAIVAASAALAGWLMWRERAPRNRPEASAPPPGSAPAPVVSVDAPARQVAPPSPAPAQPAPPRKSAPGSAGRFRLAGTQGALSGTVIPVDDEIVVSRRPLHWVVVPDATVSAPHAALDLGQEPARVKDLGSRNGTRLGATALGGGYVDLPAGQAAAITAGSLGLELQGPALRVARGPQQGRSFSLPAGCAVLSRREIPVFVTGPGDSRVSDAHALLAIDGGQLTIKDLNSSNGVRVNQSRLSGAAQLNPGDVVEIGGTSFTVEH
jgi:pSer/pThr/pTyr-binding forkhead associated (FHA) protein